MTAADDWLNQQERFHVAYGARDLDSGDYSCQHCEAPFPCPVARLVAALRAVETLADQLDETINIYEAVKDLDPFDRGILAAYRDVARQLRTALTAPTSGGEQE